MKIRLGIDENNQLKLPFSEACKLTERQHTSLYRQLLQPLDIRDSFCPNEDSELVQTFPIRIKLNGWNTCELTVTYKDAVRKVGYSYYPVLKPVLQRVKFVDYKYYIPFKLFPVELTVN